MYLESIFLAGDIRAQLPEEAKKFDNIDKLFKKVGKSLHVHWVTSFITSRPVCVYSCSQLRELWFYDLFMYVL